MSAAARDEAIIGFSSGRYQIITSCELISEGFDVPACDGCLLLRPTMSESLYLQQVGRALRPSPGKQFAVILDHVGNVARHGLPDDERVWTLEGRVRGDSVEIVECPQCYAVLPRGIRICPECECSLGMEDRDSRSGSQRESLRQVDGELIELTPQMIEAQREARRNQVRSARTREELMQLARERGYNPRWVDHVLRSRNAR
jgi:superfamily II DNA or RNA helicase